MKANNLLQVTTKSGVQISVPIQLDKMSAAEKAAYLKFTSTGSLSHLSEDELAILKNQQALADGGGHTDPAVIRFDFHIYKL